jgi:hypothetical protein
VARADSFEISYTDHVNWLRNILVKRSARARIATARTFPANVQHAISQELSAFINMCSISSELLPSFLSAAIQERHDAIASGASSKRDPRWVLASLKEDWCVARLIKTRGGMPPAMAD